MNLEELLLQADEEINYPFENVLERYLPMADEITDYICVCVIVLEDVMSGQGLGPIKKEVLMVGLRAMWVQVPMLPFLRPIFDPMFEVAMSAAIDFVVGWINSLFPEDVRAKGWDALVKETDI